jgi:hypothetical protein
MGRRGLKRDWALLKNFIYGWAFWTPGKIAIPVLGAVREAARIPVLDAKSDK